MILIACASLLFQSLCGDPAAVVIDGYFDDWPTQQSDVLDPAGDAPTGGLDLLRLAVANDAHYLFMLLETGAPFHLQQDHALTLYLDSDDDRRTGLAAGDLGADLVWHFNERKGWFYGAGDRVAISHADIGLAPCPAMMSSRFEWALDRSALPDGRNPLFPGRVLRFFIADELLGGDRIPAPPAAVRYELQADSNSITGAFALRKSADDLRIVAYNVEQGGSLNDRQPLALGRILRALQPDVVGLQEFYGQPAERARNLVNAALPGTWFAAKLEPDLIMVSRYPIRQAFLLDGFDYGATGAFVIAAGKDLDLLIFLCHLPCCDRDDERERAMDKVIASIRDIGSADSPLQVARGIPVIIMGDLNLVGRAGQYTAFRDGRIVDTATFGRGGPLDWGGRPLLEAVPLLTGRPLAQSWFKPKDSYAPARIDFFFYSGSRLTLTNSFLLDTPGLSPQELAAAGLHAEDSAAASDHRPLVADLKRRHN